MRHDQATPTARPRCRRESPEPPISWGVCEVPGLGPPARPATGSSTEMRDARAGRHRVRAGRLPAGRPGARGRAARRLRPERGRRLPPGAAARPRPRPAARGRRVHRRLPRGGAGVVVLAAVTGVDGLRRPPGARRGRLEDAARQPRPDRRPRREPRRRRQPAPARRHDGRDRPRRSSGCSPARRSGCASTPATCSSAAPTRSRSPRPQPTGRRTCTSRTSTRGWPRQVHRRRARLRRRRQRGHLPAARPGRRRHRGDGRAP